MDRKTDLIRESFDRWAAHWDDEVPNAELLDFLLSKIPDGRYPRILDLACGTGVMSKRLRERFGGEVLGLDLSPAMIEVAKRKYEGQQNLSFASGDFYAYEGAKFDLILLHNAYPHFLDVDAFCEKAYLSLNENGILAVMHSCGRKELNHHHEAHASPISFLLSSPKEEANRFEKHFDTLSFDEADSFYYFLLKRKA